jgi:hypothetical protein
MAIIGLTPGTLYHARLVATNSDGTTFGTGVTFTTTGTPPPPPPAPPTAVTGSVSGIGTTTATLNGSVNPRGKATMYRFERGTTTAYGSPTTATSAGSGTVAQAVTATLTGLSPRTTYHVRLVAANSDGTTNGLDVVFTTASSTQPPPPPLDVAVTGLKVSPSMFRAARSGASVTTSAIRNRVRTRVSYTLSDAASVRFAVERSSVGRRVDGRCVRSTRSNASRTRCTRYVRVSGSFARTRGAGTDRFTFSGRMGGRALKPGRYRLLVTPGAGRTARATFRVIK